MPPASPNHTPAAVAAAASLCCCCLLLCCCWTLSVLINKLQVLASVFGPREVDSRADMQQDKAIIKCEYAMAAFSTGELLSHRLCSSVLLSPPSSSCHMACSTVAMHELVVGLSHLLDWCFPLGAM
jgi:hypothetical protein